MRDREVAGPRVVGGRPGALLVVARVVLDVRDQALVLDRLDPRHRELAGEVGILAAERLEHAARERRADDVDGGREDDVVALLDHLVGDHAGVAGRVPRVEAGAESDRRGHGGRHSGANPGGAVGEVDRGDPNPLDAVARAGVSPLAAGDAGQLVAAEQRDLLVGGQLPRAAGRPAGRRSSEVSHHGRVAGSPQRPSAEAPAGSNVSRISGSARPSSCCRRRLMRGFYRNGSAEPSAAER